jgi:tRNA (mo5U34)-methyltransferase
MIGECVSGISAGPGAAADVSQDLRRLLLEPAAVAVHKAIHPRVCWSGSGLATMMSLDTSKLEMQMMKGVEAIDINNPRELAMAAEAEVWFHSINLGHGVVTKGQKTAPTLAKELEALRLPPLVGKSVLDIGAFDGFYSFETERRGAARVVSMDLHMWELETSLSEEYLADCAANGVPPTPPYRTDWLRWRLDRAGLPGKRRFDLAHRALGSRAEAVVQDFMLADPQMIGTFDVVLFLGVLYHTQNPLAALQKVASLTREVVVIETEAMEVPGAGDLLLCEFFPSNELNGDYSNWWSPNVRALQGLLRAAGFNSVEVIQGPPSLAGIPAGAPPVRYRAMVHARKA